MEILIDVSLKLFSCKVLTDYNIPMHFLNELINIIIFVMHVSKIIRII